MTLSNSRCRGDSKRSRRSSSTLGIAMKQISYLCVITLILFSMAAAKSSAFPAAAPDADWSTWADGGAHFQYRYTAHKDHDTEPVVIDLKIDDGYKLSFDSIDVTLSKTLPPITFNPTPQLKSVQSYFTFKYKAVDPNFCIYPSKKIMQMYFHTSSNSTIPGLGGRQTLILPPTAQLPNFTPNNPLVFPPQTWVRNFPQKGVFSSSATIPLPGITRQETISSISFVNAKNP